MEKENLLEKIKTKLQAKEANRDARKANGDYFNIFELCKIGEKENIFSNIIANLLDPGWKHGQGNIFLKKFCNHLGIEFECAGNTTVVREEAITGRRPDIVIRNGSTLIVIENKTGTCDHEEQLQDYWNWMCDKNKNPYVSNKILIYLTKNGEHPRCDLDIEEIYNNSGRNENPEEYKNVSSVTMKGKDNDKFILLPYSEIRDWCAHCSIISGIPECVADAFKQYANFIELWLNKETDDVDIIEFCAQDFDTTHAIYLSDSEDNATQWVKNNYAQIIKTYIAFKFSGKEWKGNLLEIASVDGSPFRITIQFANNKIRYGIAQSNDYPTLYMDYNDVIKKEAEKKGYKYKDNAKTQNRHDCWWVFYRGDSEAKEEKAVDRIIEEIEKISEMTELLNAFVGINASESK